MLKTRSALVGSLLANWPIIALVVVGITLLCSALFMAERYVQIHLAGSTFTPMAEHEVQPVTASPAPTAALLRLLDTTNEIPTPTESEDRLMSSDDERLFNAPASDLPLQVTGIISASQPERSLLIVLSNNRQYSLAQGEQLPESGADLVRIFPDRAIIQYRGKYAALMMAD